MKTVAVILVIVLCSAFIAPTSVLEKKAIDIEINAPIASIKIVNDTGKKVSIHTGSGFVSLTKGGSTSITCNTGKEVRWADKGKKGNVIFKISSDHCGKTLKLSKL